MYLSIQDEAKHMTEVPWVPLDEDPVRTINKKKQKRESMKQERSSSNILASFSKLLRVSSQDELFKQGSLV